MEFLETTDRKIRHSGAPYRVRRATPAAGDITCGVWESVAATLPETMAESAHYDINQLYGSRPPNSHRTQVLVRIGPPLSRDVYWTPVGRRRALIAQAFEIICAP